MTALAHLQPKQTWARCVSFEDRHLWEEGDCIFARRSEIRSEATSSSSQSPSSATGTPDMSRADADTVGHWTNAFAVFSCKAAARAEQAERGHRRELPTRLASNIQLVQCSPSTFSMYFPRALTLPSLLARVRWTDFQLLTTIFRMMSQRIQCQNSFHQVCRHSIIGSFLHRFYVPKYCLVFCSSA